MKKSLESLRKFFDMKQGSRKKLILALVLIVLCLLAILIGLIVFNRLQTKALNDHPLVLIHTPENRDHVGLGQEVSLHATARSQNGIARVELWADDALVAAQATPEGEILSPAVLHIYWEPLTAGKHTLVVQAVSNSGIRGQATIVLYADEEIAAGIEEDSAVESGGESGAAEEGAEGDAGAAPGGSAPIPGGSPPGSSDDIGDLFGDGEPESEDEPEPSAEGGDPIALKVEILALETVESYEELHCYVSFGESNDAPSQWYPDFDGDQSTNDTFPSSDGRNWDVEPYLSGDSVPFIIWPEDQSLGINSTCVGIANGGASAPELGQVSLIRRPETWDGITRKVVSDGGEGSYTIDYRIYKEGETPEDLVGKEIDPDMTIPTNLHVQNWANPFGEIVGRSLMWDYELDDEAEPIDGFILYMNETMQWVVPADRTFTDVPSQWFKPPCGETYSFTVSAYRGSPVAGTESYPSDPLSFYTADIGDPICVQTYVFSFNTMTTGSLPEGGLYNGMYGSFYVNDESVDFDGRCEGPGLCGEVGLYENYEYDLHSTTSYLGNGPTQFLLTQGDDHSLHYGYEVNTTYTRGLGQTSTGRFCYAEGTIDWVDLARMIDPIVEHTMTASLGPVRDFCQVSYTIEPLGSGPSVQPGQPLPLPLLAVEEITIDDTGWLQIQIRNEGNADWTHNIPFSLTKNSGEPIGSYTWPASTIAPGDRVTLEYNMGGNPQPMDVCVILDPENEAPEQDDRFESPREPHCHPLPDLSISRVSYNPESETLTLIVDNTGGTQERTDLSLQLNIPGIETRPVLQADVTLHQYGVNLIDIPGITEEIRDAMVEGYTVSVDPTNDIEETDEENNTYTVPPGAVLRLHWVSVHSHYYPYYSASDSTQEQRYSLTVSTGAPEPISSVGSFGSNTVATWSTGRYDLEREIQSGPWEGARLGSQQHNLNEWVEFSIAGDEYLYLRASGEMQYLAYDWRSLGWGATRFSPDNWGASRRTISEDEECWYIGLSYPYLFDQRDFDVRPPSPWQNCGDWSITVFICRVE
jgi:hypothetical protein